MGLHCLLNRKLTALRLIAALAAGLVAGSAFVGPVTAAEVVDLELVLAVDTSSSVSAEEFDLQMRGLAGAFRHPDVLAAIEAAGDLGVAVSLIQWSDTRKQFTAVDWVLLRSAAASEAFAEEIDRTPRILVGGGTAIGGALKFALESLLTNGYEGRRKVIDLSGDGRTNQGEQPQVARDLAVAAGVTINGLAILNEDPVIDRYYYSHVIGGTGAFVISATDYEDFSAAMLEKLVKEISGTPIALGPDGPVPPPRGRPQLGARPAASGI